MPKLKVYFNPESNSSINVEGMGVYVAEQEYAKVKVRLHEAEKSLTNAAYGQSAVVEQLKEQIADYQRLTAELNQVLHVGVEAPAKPSLCDLVSYARSDIKKLKEQNQLFLTALQRIALWDEHDVKTRVDIGFMGQQRHYRAIAADAVLGQPCNVTAIKMKAVDDFTGWLANAPYFKAKLYEVTEIYRYSALYLSDLAQADSNSVGKSVEGEALTLLNTQEVGRFVQPVKGGKDE